MTRICVFGDTGDGKTLMSIDIIAENYFKYSYNVFSNIFLNQIEYTHIYDTAFTDLINPKKKNIVFIDEVGEITRGHYQFTFNSLVSQSRKSIGEKQIFLMTTQTQNQANIVLKGMVDFFAFPTILERDSETEKPLLMEIDWYMKEKRSTPLTFVDCNDKMPIGLRYRYVHDACAYYDTGEIVEGLADGRFFKYLDLYQDFVGSDKQIKNLKAIINEKHGQSLSEAERNARKIINAKEWGFWDDFLKWKEKRKEKEPK